MIQKFFPGWNPATVMLTVTLVLLIPIESLRAQGGRDSLVVLFNLPTPEGENLSLGKNLGTKMTVLVFWATWGNDSARILEAMELLYQKYQRMGLQVIAVCVDSQKITQEDKRRIIDSVKRKNLTFPIVLDDSLKTFRAYSVVAVPTTFLIDGQMKLVYKLSGFPIVGRDELTGLITEQFEVKRATIAKIERIHNPSKEALRVYNMARVNHEHGLVDLSTKYAGKAINLDSLYSEPYVLLAEIAIEEGRNSEADSICAIALKLEPTLPDARSVHSLLLAKRGKANEAVAVLSDLLNSDSSSSITRAFYGYALAISGNETKGLEQLSRAEAIAPSDYRIPMLRAEIYERAGRKTDAQTERLKARHLIKSQ